MRLIAYFITEKYLVGSSVHQRRHWAVFNQSLVKYLSLISITGILHSPQAHKTIDCPPWMVQRCLASYMCHDYTWRLDGNNMLYIVAIHARFIYVDHWIYVLLIVNYDKVTCMQKMICVYVTCRWEIRSEQKVRILEHDHCYGTEDRSYVCLIYCYISKSILWYKHMYMCK